MMFVDRQKKMCSATRGKSLFLIPLPFLEDKRKNPTEDYAVFV